MRPAWKRKMLHDIIGGHQEYIFMKRFIACVAWRFCRARRRRQRSGVAARKIKTKLLPPQSPRGFSALALLYYLARPTKTVMLRSLKDLWRIEFCGWLRPRAVSRLLALRARRDYKVATLGIILHKRAVILLTTPFALHYEKIHIHLRESSTNSAKIHSLARKSEHLRINQIQ